MAGLLLAVAGAAMVRGQQAAVDTILTNGKIITVDDRFSIAQAVAIRGDRVVAVGTNQDIARLAGPNTRRIDLGGKAVIPGLIDAHAHLTRAAETWAIEARFDDVDSRKQALEIVRAKAQALRAGEWVFNLGGWSYDQFADNPTPLTRAELDQAAPNNPVYLQFSRCCAFMNSRGAEAMGLAGMNEPSALCTQCAKFRIPIAGESKPAICKGLAVISPWPIPRKTFVQLFQEFLYNLL